MKMAEFYESGKGLGASYVSRLDKFHVKLFGQSIFVGETKHMLHQSSPSLSEASSIWPGLPR